MANAKVRFYNIPTCCPMITLELSVEELIWLTDALDARLTSQAIRDIKKRYGKDFGVAYKGEDARLYYLLSKTLTSCLN